MAKITLTGTVPDGVAPAEFEALVEKVVDLELRVGNLEKARAPTSDPVEPPPVAVDPPIAVAPAVPVLLSKNTLADILPVSAPETASAFHGHTAESALGYCGSNYAPDRWEWYRLAPGGHDTGLNFVTAYSEATGLYRLVAPPAPLCTSPDDDIVLGKNADGTAITEKVSAWQARTGSVTVSRPKWGMMSCHGYGGNAVYSSRTRCFYCFETEEGFPLGDRSRGWWQFDPDDCAGVNHGWTYLSQYPVELTANNMSIMTWETAAGNLAVLVGQYGRAGIPNIIDGMRYGEYNLTAQAWESIATVSGSKLGYTSGLFDPSDGFVWCKNYDGNVYRIGLPPTPSQIRINRPVAGFWNSSPLIPVGAYLYSWTSTEAMLRIAKDGGQWQIRHGLNLPLGQFVYDSIRLDDDKTSFIYDAGVNGFWSVPIPADGWENIEPVRAEKAQSHIDKAAPGDTVTIPAGYYRDSLHIDKSLDVHLDGVVLMGMVQDKAPVVVSTTAKVRIYDYECLGTGGDTTSAGLRDAGQDFDIELYNAHISGCPNGILMGNGGGGKLLVDGGLIERMTGDDRSHGIYFGLGASLTMRNVTINGDGIRQLFGHLYKSRALETTLENCEGLGGDGHYSRELDFPCGGAVKVIGGTFHKGINSDNADHMSYAVEGADNCTGPDGVNRCTLPGSIEYSAEFTSDKPGTRFLTTHVAVQPDLTGATIQAGVALA